MKKIILGMFVFVGLLSMLGAESFAADLQVELVPMDTKNIVIARRAEKGRFDVYGFRNEIIGYDEMKNPVYKKVITGKIKEVFCSKVKDESSKFDAKSEKECLQKIVENYDVLEDKR